ncbi:hypothetical protein TNIN_2651 [Trichonephila inaurata madagascariensis]|uniref:Uncharacterized protein n=1 Tax=Trichonephila inaurata madagascariensis TaxID=2747483 RepID=A0A8X6I9K7_9ARAC|nr:hypothetical protein TNIN_2651 [Trichonephila inaurata madagascariensis]
MIDEFKFTNITRNRSDVLDCRPDLENLSSLGKLQSFSGFLLTVEKRVFLSSRKFLVLCPSIPVKVRAQEDLCNRVSHKSWWNAILNLHNGPRHRAVAEFRLATGYYFLRNYPYRIKVFPSPIYTLYSSGEVIGSPHLSCSAQAVSRRALQEARNILDQ